MFNRMNRPWVLVFCAAGFLAVGGLLLFEFLASAAARRTLENALMQREVLLRRGGEAQRQRDEVLRQTDFYRRRLEQIQCLLPSEDDADFASVFLLDNARHRHVEASMLPAGEAVPMTVDGVLSKPYDLALKGRPDDIKALLTSREWCRLMDVTDLRWTSAGLEGRVKTFVLRREADLSFLPGRPPRVPHVPGVKLWIIWPFRSGLRALETGCHEKDAELEGLAGDLERLEYLESLKTRMERERVICQSLLLVVGPGWRGVMGEVPPWMETEPWEYETWKVQPGEGVRETAPGA